MMQNSTYANVNSRDNALSSLMSSVATTSSNLNTQRTQLDVLRTQIDDLVRLKDATTNTALKLQYAQQLVPMFANYASLNTALQTNAAAITTVYDQGVLNAKILNNGLNTSSVAAQNDQLLNQIVINKLSGLALTPTDETNLLSIATQCYADGGTAVPAARAYYLQWFGRYILDDECSSPVVHRAAGNPSNTVLDVLISPNPTDVMLRISFPIELVNTSKQLTISDINGRKIQSITIDKSVSEYNLSTVRYANGVYLIKVNSDNGLTKTLKFVVKH
jgi:hypothetical protein